ncbi:MAG: TIR domain-containing protein [Paludibacter sp.]|nr:TIR domain-containing protein [Paludibacter sp.]
MSETSLTTCPRVFISYSWSSETHKDWVLSFAHALSAVGVDVVLDRWVLNPGCDKYVFMEKCVHDPDIQKVLIICDKLYKTKADSRKGGVGDETLIISPEMYRNENQEKFIAVVVELDESGEACLPIYLKSRIYIDLHNRKLDGDNFKDLVRNIYGKPSLKKPQLGSAPDWLDEEPQPQDELQKIVSSFEKEVSIPDMSASRSAQFIELFIKKLNDYDDADFNCTADSNVQKLQKIQPLLNTYMDFLYNHIYSTENTGEFVTKLFEDLYNRVGVAKGTYRDDQYQEYEYFIWECFVSTAALLLTNERFADLHEILSHTYYLRHDYFKTAEIKPQTYCHFCRAAPSINEGLKNLHSEKNLLSYSAEYFINQIPLPSKIPTQVHLVYADIFLHQYSYIITDDRVFFTRHWSPFTYVYKNDEKSPFMIRLSSRKYCEKIKYLFGAESVEDLKKIIASHPSNPEGYSRSLFCGSIPQITDDTPLEEIASRT